jgi:predicted RNase H-like HicB family nuclease
MEKQKQLLFTIERTDTGFSAYAGEYPIFTTGKSLSELERNAYQACKHYFKEEGLVEKFDIKIQELQQFKHSN